ncbi:hypothetical protein EDC01DRAFT_635980 [Geopyxis carbonaria]|nr:hypothetical protein EDC01DRAFT_635980 [Geopyxis carbonaria]
MYFTSLALSTLVAVAVAQCNINWRYPALGSYYTGEISIGLLLLNLPGSCITSDYSHNITYNGLLYIGQPTGIINPGRKKPNELEMTLLGWPSEADAPECRDSPDLKVNFNTSTHILGYWNYKVAGTGSQSFSGGWDIVAGATFQKQPPEGSEIRDAQFVIETESCGKAYTVQWDMTGPPKSPSQGAVLSTEYFDDKEVRQMQIAGTLEDKIGTARYWVSFSGTIEEGKSDELYADDQRHPKWRETKERNAVVIEEGEVDGDDNNTQSNAGPTITAPIGASWMGVAAVWAAVRYIL